MTLCYLHLVVKHCAVYFLCLKFSKYPLNNFAFVLPLLGQQRMCPRAVGRAAAGAGFPAQSQPRTRQHSKCQTGAEEYD